MCASQEIPHYVPAERQRLILQLVLMNGVLRISDLAEEFDVSEMTIRRDLDMLAQSGQIERKFGAAVALEQASHEVNYQTRMITNLARKEAIAGLALSMIRDGDTVALDASTTCLTLARKLAQRTDLTVVTNSLDVAQVLRYAQLQVILTGGWIRQMKDSVVGPLALHTLENIRVDQMFFSAHGVLFPDGFVDPDFNEIEIKRAMLRRSARATALIDSSKFGRRALGCIAGLDSIDHLITDSSIAQETLAKLAELGVDVRVVGLGDQTRTP